MLHCRQGLHAFLRAYYHYKSADWSGNRPYRLAAWSAAELAKLPTYYVMNLHHSMPEAVAPHAPPAPLLFAFSRPIRFPDRLDLLAAVTGTSPAQGHGRPLE